jgi:hypothetical protein
MTLKDWIVDTVKGSPKNTCRAITITLLTISFIAIAGAMFIRTFINYSYPRFNVEMNAMDSHRMESPFPKLAICPGDESVTLSNVECEYTDIIANADNTPERPSYKRDTKKITAVKKTKHVMETKLYDCYDVNYEKENSPIVSSRDSHAYMGCVVTSNGDARVQPYSYAFNRPWSNWAGWTHVKNKEATAISVHAEEWGPTGDVFYEIIKEDEERRLKPDEHSLKFSINFAGTWKTRYMVSYQYDFWTTLGVIGGILLIHILIYFAVMKLFSLTRWGKEYVEFDYNTNASAHTESKVATTLPIVGYGSA